MTCCNYAACPCPETGHPAYQTGDGWRKPDYTKNPPDVQGVCCICDWEAQKTSASPHKMWCPEIEYIEEYPDATPPREGETLCLSTNCCGTECDPEKGGANGAWEYVFSTAGCTVDRNWVAADPQCPKPDAPDWIPDICSCGCLKVYEAGEDPICEAPLVFQEATCECKCEKTEDECSAPTPVLDSEACECVECNLTEEDCVQDEQLDEEKCECICPENLCEGNAAAPHFKAPCDCVCETTQDDCGLGEKFDATDCSCKPCVLDCPEGEVPDEACLVCVPEECEAKDQFGGKNDANSVTFVNSEGVTVKLCCPPGTEPCVDEEAKTGECIEPCPEGSVLGGFPSFPCDCRCDNDTFDCNGTCYDACPSHLVRSSYRDCQCMCPDFSHVECTTDAGVSDCYPECTGGKERDGDCNCACPDGEVTCGGLCRPACPEGKAYNENCDCDDYGSSSWLKSLIP